MITEVEKSERMRISQRYDDESSSQVCESFSKNKNNEFKLVFDRSSF